MTSTAMTQEWLDLDADGDVGTADFSIDAIAQTVTLDFDQLTGVDGSEIPDDDPYKDYIDINQDHLVDSDIATDRGVTSITILEGTYEVDYSSNSNGTVVLDATIVN